MKKFVILLWTLILGFANSEFLNEECKENPESSNCVALRDTSPESVDVLEISTGSMTTIYSAFFYKVGYQNVSEIKLINSHVENIEIGAFEGLPFLKRLDLNNNEIRLLNEGMFRGLEYLEELILAYNSLHTIAKGALKNLIHLEYLNLSNNELSSFPTEIELLGNLRYLDLSHNKFALADIIVKSNSLNVLKLSFCNIDVLTEDSFKGVPELLFLDISDNDLTILPEQLLTPMNNLMFLDVSENPFVDFYPAMYIPESMVSVIKEVPSNSSTYEYIEKQILLRNENHVQSKVKLFYGVDKEVLTIIETVLLCLLFLLIVYMFFMIFVSIYKKINVRKYKKLNDFYSHIQRTV